MKNIGLVLYTKSEKPGTLHAQWSHARTGNGTGIASGGTGDGYVGHYTIHPSATSIPIPSADRELDIQKEGDTYRILWKNNGKITAEGIGMEVAEGLAAGWRDVEA